MSWHLGWAMTPFIDDELDLRTREQVLQHLLHCDDCRREVEGLRRLKDAVRGLPSPSLPGSLASRLDSLVQDSLTPRPSFVPPSVLPPVQRFPRQRVRRSAMQGAIVVLGLGGALALGAPPAGVAAGPPPEPGVSPTGTTQLIDMSMLTSTTGRPSRLQLVSASYPTRP